MLRRPTPREFRILDLLATHDDLDAEEIRQFLGLPLATIKTIAKRLRDVGDLQGDRSIYVSDPSTTKYRITDQGRARLGL